MHELCSCCLFLLLVVGGGSVASGTAVGARVVVIGSLGVPVLSTGSESIFVAGFSCCDVSSSSTVAFVGVASALWVVLGRMG